MDISFLLVLQEFRNGVGGILADFMSKMTYFGEVSILMIIMAIVYWCVSKSFGTYLLMGWSGNRMLNGLVKMTACVYRPWMRDPRIIPYEKVGGYSFPSGHTMNGASLFGGAAIRKELPGKLRVLMGVLLALVALSRMYMGVHTPQDVITGAVLGLLVMWLIAKLLAWIEKHPEKDILVMIIGIAIAVAVLVFTSLKPYPVDYDADGKLLIDGARMAGEAFRYLGWCSGLLVGWVLERRFICFSTDVPMMTRISRLVSGLFGYYLVNLILMPLLRSWIPGAGGTVAACFLQLFYVMFIFPWFMNLLEKAALKK